MVTPVRGTRTFALDEGDTEGTLTLRNETGHKIADYKIHVNSDDFVQPGFLYLRVERTRDAQGNEVSDLINSIGNPGSTDSYGSDVHRDIPAERQVNPGEEFTITYRLSKAADEPAHIQVSLSTIVENEDGSRHVPIIGGEDVPHVDITVFDKIMEIIETVKGIYSLLSPLLSSATTKNQAVLTGVAAVLAMRLLTNQEFKSLGRAGLTSDRVGEAGSDDHRLSDDSELGKTLMRLAKDPRFHKILAEME